MALGSRVTKPRNIILIDIDPAVDQEASDIGAYLDSLFDEKHLKFVDGEEPTRFKCKQLTDEQKDALDGYSNERERFKWAIRFSLLSVKNYKVETDEGDNVPELEFSEVPKFGRIMKLKSFQDLHLTNTMMTHLFLGIQMLSEAKKN